MEPKFCRSVIALFAMHAFASFIACCLPWQSLCGQESERGAAIYSQQCASCHGPHGQGVSGHYENSLTGDLSVPELAKVIQETMPETAPKSLSIEDSQAIAAYIHNEFYSPYAQLRNAPPKRALSHLTADQFRRSVMDLMVSSVGRAQAWKGDGGLQRTVNQGDWSKDRKEVEKKIESKLTWDWGDGKPVPEIDKEKWQIQWSGSILAPATGVYEFSLDATINAKL